MVPRGRIELPTQGFSVLCSTNWAIWANQINLKIIQELHKTDFKFVIVSSGGGSNAIGTLLKVPGASNSVLEAYIPYAKESLDFYLLRKPDFYCSKDTTLRMAARAYSCLLYTSDAADES